MSSCRGGRGELGGGEGGWSQVGDLTVLTAAIDHFTVASFDYNYQNLFPFPIQMQTWHK